MKLSREKGKIDWLITLLPLAIIIALCILFFFMPEQSNAVLSQIRFFFGDTFGTYYLVIGLGIFCSLFLLPAQSTAILYWARPMKNQSIHFLHGVL